MDSSAVYLRCSVDVVGSRDAALAAFPVTVHSLAFYCNSKSNYFTLSIQSSFD